MRISPDQIQKEIFINIMICFRCYQVEDHITANCTKKDLNICSKCAGSHSWRDCTSSEKKCINCGGGHRTMAMACPKRKQILKEKEEKEREKQKNKSMQTYAEVAKPFKDEQQQNKV